MVQVNNGRKSVVVGQGKGAVFTKLLFFIDEQNVIGARNKC